MQLKAVVVVLVIGIAVLLPRPASAHRPIFVDDHPGDPTNALEIPDPDISWAIYAALSTDDVHFYRFEVPSRGLEFSAQMTLPARHEYRGFDPWFALIGPELPQDSSVPFQLSVDHGALLAPAARIEEEFFEPFTQTRYLLRQKIDVKLTPGTHFIAVFHPDGKEGRYALTVGKRETWGWSDLLRFPSMWLRVRWWYSESQTLILLVALAAAAVVIARFIVGRFRTPGTDSEQP